MKNHTLLGGALTALCFATPLCAQIEVFGGEEDRKVTRIFYYTRDGGFVPKGQFSMDWGTAKWKKDYENKEAFDAMTRGKRWRFGGGPWTRLDTNVALTIGGVSVAPGSYYCVLERTQDDKINLVLLDPTKMREKKMDAFQANDTKGGTAIALKWTQVEKKVEQLTLKLTAEKGKPQNVTLSAAFGPHRLSVAVQAKV